MRSFTACLLAASICIGTADAQTPPNPPAIPGQIITDGTGRLVAGSATWLNNAFVAKQNYTATLGALGALTGSACQFPIFNGAALGPSMTTGGFGGGLSCDPTTGIVSVLGASSLVLPQFGGSGANNGGPENKLTWSGPLAIPSGTIATLAAGASVTNPGTGTAEEIEQVQTNRTQGGGPCTVSCNYNYADFFRKVRRSNSGTAMSDSLPPSGATALTNGVRVDIYNADSVATDTIAAGSGTTILGGASYPLAAYRSLALIFNSASSNWEPDKNSATAILGSDSLVARISAPPAAFASLPGVSSTPPWTVIRPDGAVQNCAGSIANCVDKVFADPTINNNWSYQIDGGGGLYGSNNAVAVSGTLTGPVLRNQSLLMRSLGIYGILNGGSNVFDLDSALESATLALGGQYGNSPNNGYTNSIVHVYPRTSVPFEGQAVYASPLTLGVMAAALPTPTVFTGSMSGTALTSSVPLAIGDVVSGAGVPNNTYVVSGSGANWVTNNSASVSSETMDAYVPIQSTFNIDASLANILYGTDISSPEVNGGGNTNTGIAKYPILVTGITSTTGLQAARLFVGFIHNCVIACVQNGVGTTNQKNIHDNLWTLPDLEPMNGAQGINTFGSDEKWFVSVEDSADGGGAGTVSVGMVLQPGANRNEVHIHCSTPGGTTISTCIQINSGSVGNTVYITTEGTVTTPVFDQSGNKNTVWLNGVLQTVLAALPTSAPSTHCAQWSNSGVINVTTCP